MATQSVEYKSCKKIDCCVDLPAPVFLCIPPEIIAPHLCPDVGAEDTPDQPFSYGYIEASMTKETCVQGVGCVSSYWLYWFEYDDTQLIEGTILVGTDITGLICQNCFTTWVENVTGNEVFIETDEETGIQTLVTQHGCEFPITPTAEGCALAVLDTESINLTIVADPETGCQTLSADTTISPNAGNLLTEAANGLFVSPLAVTDTSTVDLTIAANNLSSAVKISVDANNAISAHADGIYSAQNLLTVTDTSSVDLTITGTAPQNLQGTVKVSADSGNALSAHVDGLYVSAGDCCAEILSDSDFQESGILAGPTNLAVSATATRTITLAITNTSASRTMRALVTITPMVEVEANLGDAGDIAAATFQLSESVNGGGAVDIFPDNSGALAGAGLIQVVQATLDLKVLSPTYTNIFSVPVGNTLTLVYVATLTGSGTRGCTYFGFYVNGTLLGIAV